MAKKITQVVFYLTNDFVEEWEFFLKFIEKDPRITELVSKNKANRRRRVSVALREVIRGFNKRARQSLLEKQRMTEQPQ